MLLGSLQENLLVLLSYDAEHAPIIRGAVEPGLYSGPYREIAARIYDYLDRFKKPPKDHLADLFGDKLEAKGTEGSLYADIVQNIHDAQVGINTYYVMSQLETFTRRQALRSMAVELAKLLQRDTEEAIDAASVLIASGANKSLALFDPGTRLSDKTRALDFLDIQEEAFPTGIPELDRRNFGPTRKELWLGIGNTKTGKTWMLIQLAKAALMARIRVCHITLEMSEARVAQRYLQALFAISKRKDTLISTKFQTDQLGRLTGFDEVPVTPKLTFDDPAIHSKLGKKFNKYTARLMENIFIKQFPTGQVTISQLEAYLDNLEAREKFTPDLLIVDYPDLLKLDKDNYRLAVDEAYKRLRGIAVARNIAVAVVSQSHRGAAQNKLVRADNVAEAYSKIAHADTIITYSQTDQEKRLGLARLHVAGGRNDQDRITVVISQQYAMGTFVVYSTLMQNNYWASLGQESQHDDIQTP